MALPQSKYHFTRLVLGVATALIVIFLIFPASAYADKVSTLMVSLQETSVPNPITTLQPIEPIEAHPSQDNCCCTTSGLIEQQPIETIPDASESLDEQATSVLLDQSILPDDSTGDKEDVESIEVIPSESSNFDIEPTFRLRNEPILLEQVKQTSETIKVIPFESSTLEKSSEEDVTLSEQSDQVEEYLALPDSSLIEDEETEAIEVTSSESSTLEKTSEEESTLSSQSDEIEEFVALPDHSLVPDSSLIEDEETEAIEVTSSESSTLEKTSEEESTLSNQSDEIEKYMALPDHPLAKEEETETLKVKQLESFTPEQLLESDLPVQVEEQGPLLDDFLTKEKTPKRIETDSQSTQEAIAQTLPVFQSYQWLLSLIPLLILYWILRWQLSSPGFRGASEKKFVAREKKEPELVENDAQPETLSQQFPVQESPDQVIEQKLPSTSSQFIPPDTQHQFVDAIADQDRISKPLKGSITINAQHHCYELTQEQIAKIRFNAYRQILEPGSYIIRIKDGAFSSVNANSITRTEPWIILQIDGGRFINRKTESEVSTTWICLHGYADTLKLGVIDPTTIYALIFGTEHTRLLGQVTVSILKIDD